MNVIISLVIFLRGDVSCGMHVNISVSHFYSHKFNVLKLTMSKQINAGITTKIPPSIHKVHRSNASREACGKHGIKSNLKCTCLNSIYEKVPGHAITCDDSAIVDKCKCNICGATIYHCSHCGTTRNFYKDRHSANRHRRKKHSVNLLNENTIDGNEVDEHSEIAVALTGDFNENRIENELNYIKFMKELHLEDEIYRQFIKHLNNDTARQYLVAMSQDKRFSEERCANLSSVDIDLQMKLTRLHNELTSKQQTRLAEIIRLVMQSMKERDTNDKACAFTNIPSTEKSIQRTCLRSKTSIMKNIPSPKITYDDDLGVIEASYVLKGGMMIGLDVALINSKKAIEDIGKCRNNMVSDGAGIRKEIMELANQLKNNDEDIYMLPYNEFRDGFMPNSSVTSNEGVLLHAFTMQPRDSTFDDPSYTYPTSLGHKNKTNMINEKTYINSINRLEDCNSPIKVFSKVHQTCIAVVLLLGFISMDQIEKRSYTLFAGGNSKYGAMHGQSCNFEDIKDKLISCKKCERKLQKGENNVNCRKCYNWEIDNSKYSKKVVDSIGGYRKKPFQLTMKMQEEESRKIFNLIVEGKLSVSLAKAQLQSLCLPSEAITLIIDSAILKHAKETNTLDMHDLNGFHHLIDRSNINGIDFPDFAMCQRKNLTCDKLSGSPMHVLYLGKNLKIEH